MIKLGGTVTDGGVRHLVWLGQRLGRDLLDAVVVNTGPVAYRSPDGIDDGASGPAQALMCYSRGRSRGRRHQAWAGVSRPDQDARVDGSCAIGLAPASPRAAPESARVTWLTTPDTSTGGGTRHAQARTSGLQRRPEPRRAAGRGSTVAAALSPWPARPWLRWRRPGGPVRGQVASMTCRSRSASPSRAAQRSR